jgi:L-lactate dehydrogenase complex protein LldF
MAAGGTFEQRAAAAVEDRRLRLAVLNATADRDARRREMWADLPDVEALRDLATHIKDHTLDHLDRHLEALIASFERLGIVVHLTSTAEEANRAVIEIARERGCRNLVKSKSMLTEELHLNEALERAGLDVLETDLGEYLLQLDHDRPSHITAPAVHKDVASCARTFERHLKVPYEENPRALVGIARQTLRERFRLADMAITGVNFAIAESGTIVLVMNEGNGRFCVLEPRVHVAMMGIEKIVPTLKDAAVMLKLLARSATGQKITVDTHFITGPKRDSERDGPERMHVVIVDAGRSKILGGPYRDVLRCIRCGACLNTCPVYPGPIGKLVTALNNSTDDAATLPHASSLCGACLEACPVRIDIPHILTDLRADRALQGRTGRGKRMMIRLAMRAMRRPVTYRLALRLARMLLRGRATDGWVGRAPGPLRGWTDAQRDLPAPARESFRELWRKGRIG